MSFRIGLTHPAKMMAEVAFGESELREDGLIEWLGGMAVDRNSG